MVTEVQSESALVKLDPGSAKNWIEETKVGSASLVQTKNPPNSDSVPFHEIIITSQVDLLFEPGIPIMQLMKNGVTVDLADVSFKTASVKDLLTLKRQRSNKTGADYDDIRFLEKLL